MDTFLESIIANDAVNMIDALGESVIYRPWGGTPRTVIAIVNRQAVDNGGASTGPRDRPRIEVTFSTNATSGIDPASVDFDRDRLYVQYVPGRANGSNNADFGFTRKLIEQTPGIWTALLN